MLPIKRMLLRRTQSTLNVGEPLSQSASPVDSNQDKDVHWLPAQNLPKFIVFQVEDQLFKASKEALESGSPSFLTTTCNGATQFSESAMNDTSGPLVQLKEVKPNSFRVFLLALSPETDPALNGPKLASIPGTPPYTFTTGEWLTILDLSTRWDFADLRRLAITKLSPTTSVPSFFSSVTPPTVTSPIYVAENTAERKKLLTRILSPRKSFQSKPSLAPAAPVPSGTHSSHSHPRFTPLQYIALGTMFRVPEWVNEPMQNLLSRQEFVSMEEEKAMGKATFRRYCVIRDCCRGLRYAQKEMGGTKRKGLNITPCGTSFTTLSTRGEGRLENVHTRECDEARKALGVELRG